MMNIDYYIEKAANMPNTSDGGSAAYHFDDVVLVKYVGLLKYGAAREGEEEIAILANRKNEMGVRTPKHLAVKRVVEGDKEICWVLQERAKGKSFASYTRTCDKDVDMQLENQKILATAPNSHYEKFVSDVCQLFNMGLELKPKNLFYDESVLDGGFTIIDLLDVNETSLDPTSLKNILDFIVIVQGIYNCTQVSSFNREATPEQVAMSYRLALKIKQRLLEAMEKVIPDFEQHKRWVLRALPFSDLELLEKNGYAVGDLSLNNDEYEQFDERVQAIIDECLKQIENGERKYWQIGANEIRIALDAWGLSSAWIYHSENERKIEGYEGSYAFHSFARDCAKDLEELVNQEFDRQLEQYAKNGDNPYLLQAIQELEKRKPSGKLY